MQNEMTPAGLARLKLDEGFRSIVYDDADGLQINGKNKNVKGNATIGYGRNLSTRGITVAEATQLLENDISSMWASISHEKPDLANVDPVWRDVLIMVEYNTGDVFEFHDMIGAMIDNDGETARWALLNSKAANELSERYTRMGQAILDRAWS